MFQSIIQDVRYAVRLLLKQPGYTTAALLTLALGIGGSTAIFTVVDAVVIEALPYPDPDRLVVVWERAPAGGRNSVSPAMFGDWAAEESLFERIAARQGRAFVLSGEGTPEQLPGALVTPGYFEVFGVRPASGRGFTADDAVAGNAVIVTHRFARRHLAGEGTRTLGLDGEPHVVVGILPEGSFDRGGPDVYRAATVPVEERRFRYLTVTGRLRDGVSVPQAESRLQAIAAAAAIQHPETNRDWGVVVEPLRDRVIGASLRQTVLLLFMGAMVHPGFDADGVLTWRLTVPATAGESPEEWRSRTRVYLRTALERLSELPGTNAAAVVSDLPVGDGWSTGVRYRSALTSQQGTPTQQFAHLQRISAGFFDALRLPLKAGRVFTEADRDGAERAVIVNETLARRAFGDGDPIGQVLHLSTGRQTDEEWRVVGVAGDVKIESLADPDDSRAEVYVPYAQHPSGDTAFALRTSGPPMALAQSVRELFRELDADRPLTRMAPLDALVGDSVAIERFRSRFVGAFAILAIVLAVIGIYGVRAFTVGQRHRELGIRLALGARPREIVRLVAGQGVALSMAGLAVGGAAALYTGRAMSALLFGVEGGDPAILAAGIVLVLSAAALAGYIPARRAARIDPAIVLRAE